MQILLMIFAATSETHQDVAAEPVSQCLMLGFLCQPHVHFGSLPCRSGQGSIRTAFASVFAADSCLWFYMWGR